MGTRFLPAKEESRSMTTQETSEQRARRAAGARLGTPRRRDATRGRCWPWPTRWIAAAAGHSGAPTPQDLDAGRGQHLRRDAGPAARWTRSASPPWPRASGEVAGAARPGGRVCAEVQRPNGLIIDKVQRAAWAWSPSSTRAGPTSPPTRRRWRSRAGNACMLRGGKEAYRTAGAIVAALQAGAAAGGPDPRRWSSWWRIPPAPVRQRADDAPRAGGSADPARRRGADPRLRGERHRPLHPDGHRHLPHLCGRVCRSGHGAGHHRKRQGQPSLASATRRRCCLVHRDIAGAVPAQAASAAGGRPRGSGPAPGGAAAGRARRGASSPARPAGPSGTSTPSFWTISWP